MRYFITLMLACLLFPFSGKTQGGFSKSYALDLSGSPDSIQNNWVPLINVNIRNNRIYTATEKSEGSTGSNAATAATRPALPNVAVGNKPPVSTATPVDKTTRNPDSLPNDTTAPAEPETETPAAPAESALVKDSSMQLGSLSRDIVVNYVAFILKKRFQMPDAEALRMAGAVGDDFVKYTADKDKKAALDKRQAELGGALAGIDSLYERAFFVALNIQNPSNTIPLQYTPKGCGKKNKTVPDNVLKEIKVERVTLGFSNWILGNVVVYGRVKSLKSKNFDSLITLNNIRVIPVSSRNYLSKIQNEPLVNSSGVYSISLSQVVSITPNDSLVFDLYVPQRTYIELRPAATGSANTPPAAVSKPSIASYFNYAIFGDLTGYIQDDAPNGKFQTEVSAMLPLWLRPVRIKQKPSQRFRRVSPFILKSFAPEICFAKFGTDNRFLPVEYFTSIDTARPNTVSDTMLIKHVNNMDVLQFANFWAGGRFNILTIEGKNPSWAVYFNFRFRYLKTELADTSRGFNLLPQVRTVSYEPEISFKRKISRNFYADMGVSVNMLRLYSNAYELSFQKQYGDGRDSAFDATPRIKFSDFLTGNAFTKQEYRKQLIWTPQITIRYSPPNSPMSGAFVRISYPFNSSQNNSFLIAQIGISKPITNLLNKAKTAAPTGN